MTATAATSAPRTDLVRGIRRWDLLAMMINATIGAGIFGLPSRIYALIGPWSLLAFPACAVLIAMVILCFSEVASRFERTGGPYLYARSAFGPTVGFVTGWLLWLVRLTSFAALSNLLVSYLAVLWPAAEAWRIAVIAAVTLGLACVNLIGVRNAALTGNAFTIGKLVPLAVLIAVGLAAVAPERLALGALPKPEAFAQAMMLLVFAFTGFEVVIIPAGEASDPRRNLPWALLCGLGVVAVVYVLIAAVCMGTLPDPAHSQRPLADAASQVMGSRGGVLLSLGAILSIVGSLGTTMLAAPRLPFAMAEWGEVPRALAATHPRFHTPWNAIGVTAACMLALSLATSFVSALTIGTVIRLLTFVATAGALLVLRRRPDAPPASFHAPAAGVVATLTLVICGWLLSSVSLRDAGVVAVMALVGLGLFWLRRRSV